MAVTLTSSPHGYFLVDSTAVPKGMVRARAIGTNYVMLVDVSSNRVIMNKTEYVDITNGDTSAAFASQAAVMTWVKNNCYASQGRRTSSASFTRPVDTTAYAAKDVVSNSTSAPTVMTFSDIVATPGTGGVIKKATIFLNDDTIAKSFKLHLYHTAPTAQNDNGAFALAYADRTKYIGSVTFSATAADGTGSAVFVKTDVSLEFVTASSATAIYGILTAAEAITPSSAMQFTIELTADEK